ncbi:Myb/SANT-like DNA-binding domain-containing protein [Xylaria palmicola]|nr:Myb/SANT-like DNA-binding domain-containing protein [Xylaria palmicola]
MADEDVSMTAAPTTAAPAAAVATATSPSSRRNADRRTPRFSWNQAYEDTFFRSLCESMQLGYKDSHNFKAGAWERAAVALRDRHGAYPEKSHLINKADNARKKFRMWRGLREDPDFLYNPSTRMVTASEEAWSRHFEKEPLSKALRGRPFDHEEYMEILFPDVIGSGGAPKRIMRPRRRNPDGSMPPRPSDGYTVVVDPALDSSTASQNPAQQMPPPAQQPPPAPTTTQAHQRPTSTAVPPHPPASASTSALTPPEETTPNTQSRKRPHTDSTPGNAIPERRRGRPSRFAPSFYTQQSTPGGPSASTGTASSSSATNPAAAAANPAAAPSQPAAPSSSSLLPAGLLETGLLSLAETLRAAACAAPQPRWPEQAVELLFREFADEDPDLQLKIAEKALTDDNKAMVFVKMTPALRRHWVGRLRDVHMRSNNPAGGGGGMGGVGGGVGAGLGLGRVGEEAS